LPKVVFLIYLMFKKNFKLLFNGQNGIILSLKSFFWASQKLARTSRTSLLNYHRKETIIQVHNWCLKSFSGEYPKKAFQFFC